MSTEIDTQQSARKRAGIKIKLLKPHVDGFICNEKSTASCICGNSFLTFGAAYAQD